MIKIITQTYHGGKGIGGGPYCVPSPSSTSMSDLFIIQI